MTKFLPSLDPLVDLVSNSSPPSWGSERHSVLVAYVISNKLKVALVVQLGSFGTDKDPVIGYDPRW